MNRRHFIKYASLATASSLLPLAPASVWGLGQDSSADFLLYLQVDGGWDVTSFCDPKVNIAGERPINHWAEKTGVREAGNLRFAPIADNAAFFNAHHQKMLVINGINTETNSHSVGQQYSHTGSNRNDRPHLAALYAYEKGQGLAMPVLAGSQFATAGLVPPTTLGREILDLIDPSRVRPGVDRQYLPADDLASIRALRRYQAETRESRSDWLPKQQRQLTEYLKATTADTQGFARFAEIHASLEQNKYRTDRHTESIRLAMSLFRAGLGLAADMSIGGFDSHEDHDAQFAERISVLTNAVNCAWRYAGQLGIADRLVVVLSSDFGRTPHYNGNNGKDHWPYGSTVVMKKNVTWTNRMVGYTDEGHFGQPIHPQSLQVDRVKGREIEPRHVMHALRGLMGVADTAAATRFDLEVDEAFNLFGV